MSHNSFHSSFESTDVWAFHSLWSNIPLKAFLAIWLHFCVLRPLNTKMCILIVVYCFYFHLFFPFHFRTQRGHGDFNYRVQCAVNMAWDCRVFSAPHPSIFSGDVNSAVAGIKKKKRKNVTGQPLSSSCHCKTVLWHGEHWLHFTNWKGFFSGN